MGESPSQGPKRSEELGSSIFGYVVSRIYTEMTPIMVCRLSLPVVYDQWYLKNATSIGGAVSGCNTYTPYAALDVTGCKDLARLNSTFDV